MLTFSDTLLLNRSYEPLRVIPWRRAVCMLFLDKIEVLEEYEHDIRSVSLTIKGPAVVRLLRYVRPRWHPIKFCRVNIFARDGYRCQYCGRSGSIQDLNYDHVLPKRLGGSTCWENIVTCCQECNRRKGGRTPQDAGMKLLRRPNRPADVAVGRLTLASVRIPRPWRTYLGETLARLAESTSRSSGRGDGRAGLRN